MTKELRYRNSAVEITELFKYLEEPLKKKIPQEIIDHYDKIKNNDYKFQINKSVSLEEQKFMPETINIFGYYFLKYCCDDIERNNLIKAADAQKKIRDEQINAKYDFNLLHPKKEEDKIEVVEEEKSLTTMESVHWYQRVLDNIKSFFKNLFGK